MDKLLAGKTALITGGFRGIGGAIAMEFAKAGADLILTSTKEASNYSNFLEQLAEYGTNVDTVCVNPSSAEDLKDKLGELLAAKGGVDILVNNAGITRDTLMLRMTEEDWDSVIDVNLKSAFNTSKLVIPMMLRKRGGSIINISSVVGLAGNAGQCNYAASKAGLIGFTNSMAKELGGKGIRANCIAPGFILTDMTSNLPEHLLEEFKKRIALKRAGQAREVANVALFLASDMSSYVTGQVINCCGGMSV